jgi:hypothetical protein
MDDELEEAILNLERIQRLALAPQPKRRGRPPRSKNKVPRGGSSSGSNGGGAAAAVSVPRSQPKPTLPPEPLGA